MVARRHGIAKWDIAANACGNTLKSAPEPFHHNALHSKLQRLGGRSMANLLETLAAIVGEGGVLTGADVSSRAVGVWREGGVQAQAIIRPRDTAQVSAVLKACHRAGQRVVAQGGRTGLVEGADAGTDEVAISLERMNRIEGVDTINRTMTVEAGAVLQTVQERADAAGLMYPLDLGGRGSCTIGGNIATNAGGNRVLRYGMTRDNVLGLEAVLADGTVVSSMNEMIKNNAGYDLKQLFIGTEGSLGVVTRAVLRLREKPRSQETLLVAVDEFDKLPALLKLMDARLGGALSAFEVMWRNFYALVTTPPAKQRPPLAQTHPYYALIEAMGGDAKADRARVEAALAEAHDAGLVVDAVVAQSEAQRLQLWAMRDDVEQCARFGTLHIFDVSLPIPQMEAYVAAVNERLAGDFDAFHNFAFGHIADGNLHFGICGIDDADAKTKVKRAVYEPLAGIGGSISAEHGVGLDKKPYLHLSRNEAEVALMRALKQALDPKGLLNAGKVFDAAPAMPAAGRRAA